MNNRLKLRVCVFLALCLLVGSLNGFVVEVGAVYTEEDVMGKSTWNHMFWGKADATYVTYNPVAAAYEDKRVMKSEIKFTKTEDSDWTRAVIRAMMDDKTIETARSRSSLTFYVRVESSNKTAPLRVEPTIFSGESSTSEKTLLALDVPPTTLQIGSWTKVEYPVSGAKPVNIIFSVICSAPQEAGSEDVFTIYICNSPVEISGAVKNPEPGQQQAGNSFSKDGEVFDDFDGKELIHSFTEGISFVNDSSTAVKQQGDRKRVKKSTVQPQSIVYYLNDIEYFSVSVSFKNNIYDLIKIYISKDGAAWEEYDYAVTTGIWYAAWHTRECYSKEPLPPGYDYIQLKLISYFDYEPQLRFVHLLSANADAAKKTAFVYGKNGFLDVENHWSKEYVNRLAGLRVIRGITPETFAPDAPISAEQFICMVVSSQNLPPVSGGAGWSAPYINKAKELLLVKDGEFDNYTRPVTRTEMARIITRELNRTNEPAATDFARYKHAIADLDSIDENDRNYVVNVYAKGIMTGFEDAAFQGNRSATRAEAAAIVLRSLDSSLRVKDVLYTVGIYNMAGDIPNQSIISPVTEAGLRYVVLTEADMASSSVLHLNNISCLVLSGVTGMGDAATKNLRSYVQNGGDLVLMGDRIDEFAFRLKIPAFDDFVLYDVAQSSGIATSEGQTILKEEVFSAGNYTGRSAIGSFVYGETETFSILTFKDAYDRSKGNAASISVHYDGLYTGGQWMQYGVEQSAFYQSEAFAKSLTAGLNKFKTRTLIGEVRADYQSRQSNWAAYLDMNVPADGFIRISDDKKHFIKPDGSKLFLVGANYVNNHYFYSSATVRGEALPVDLAEMENDFRSASEAGINAFRMWFWFNDDPKINEAIFQLARRYGIYLLITLPYDTAFYSDYQTYQADVATFAARFKDEPMVIGYDLMNEPLVDHFAHFTYDGNEPLALRMGLYEKHKDTVGARAESIANNYFVGYGPLSRAQKLDISALKGMFHDMFRPINNDGTNPTTFPGYKGSLNVTAEQKAAFDAGNQIFEDWIRTTCETIRSVDKNHYITIGHYNFAALLPANRYIDFTNEHVYDPATSFENVINNVTTMDRLEMAWPAQPIALGEFGYTSGNKGMDPHTQAVGEMITYISSFAKGYSGAFLWEFRGASKTEISRVSIWQPENKYDVIQGYGVVYYSGANANKNAFRPLAHATKVLGEYARTHAPGEGEVRYLQDSNSMGIGYVYQNKDALFAGATYYKDDMLGFDSEIPVNVMVTWNEGEVKITASADVQVKVDVSRMGIARALSVSDIEGRLAGARGTGNKFVIDLLAGETIVIR